MLYAIICFDRDDSSEARLKNRPDHVAYLESVDQTKLKLAGPLTSADPEPQPRGSLFLYEADDVEEARAFAAGDPYNKGGVFAEVHVLPWTAARGDWAR